MKVSAGFGLSAGLFGVGVGSGTETGAGVGFRTRRPDCANAAKKHNATSAAQKPACRVLEELILFRMLVREGAINFAEHSSTCLRNPGASLLN